MDEGAVAFDLGWVGGHAASEVVGGGADDGERGTEFVGDAGDEVHLQFGQVLLLPGEADEHDGGEEHEGEDGGGDTEVAPADAIDDRIE